VRHVMHLEDAAVMGSMMSMSGLGSLLGATAILWGSRSSRRCWLAFGVVGVTAALAGLAWFPFAAVAAPLVGVLSFSVSSLMGRVSQTVQESAPPELRGRIMGVYSITFSGVMPFSALAISALGDHIGYPVVMRIAAVLFGTCGLALVAASWRPLAALPPPAASEQPATSTPPA